MASQDNKSKTPATIKIAAKDASQRGEGGIDPGPGDPEATPSELPEPVSVPAPPSPSELVVKSVKSINSKAIRTINDPVSLPKSRGSSASTNALRTHKTAPETDFNEIAPRENTSSKALSSNRVASKTGSGSISGSQSQPDPSKLNVKSVHSSGKTTKASIGGLANIKTIDSAQTGPMQASQAMQANSQAGMPGEPDVVEEGETEVVQPASPTTSVSPSPSTGTSQSASPATSGASQASSPATSAGVDMAPITISGGSSKMSPKMGSRKSSNADVSDASSVGSNKKLKKKKMTKFRYHKRVTVRTHGKTNPSSVMDKVNQKDHKAGITPSTIGEMDTEELMKRAGIKGGTKTHWRVRLRQTKRTTKDGKTTVQTKVAYRDSEGNKRIKTSSTPECQKCGKKLEECKCDEP